MDEWQAGRNAFLVVQIILAEEIQQRNFFFGYTFFEEHPRCNGVRSRTEWVQKHQLQQCNGTPSF